MLKLVLLVLLVVTLAELSIAPNNTGYNLGRTWHQFVTGFETGNASN